eukprot:15354287-Ditylum_brightwellii.AAC.2
MLKAEGKIDGAVMCEADGTLLLTSKVEDEFHKQLQHVQKPHQHLINPCHKPQIRGSQRNLGTYRTIGNQ